MFALSNHCFCIWTVVFDSCRSCVLFEANGIQNEISVSLVIVYLLLTF